MGMIDMHRGYWYSQSLERKLSYPNDIKAEEYIRLNNIVPPSSYFEVGNILRVNNLTYYRTEGIS